MNLIMLFSTLFLSSNFLFASNIPSENPLVDRLSELSKAKKEKHMKKAKAELPPQQYLALVDIEKCTSTITDTDLLKHNPNLKTNMPSAELKNAVKAVFVEKCNKEVMKYLSFKK